MNEMQVVDPTPSAGPSTGEKKSPSAYLEAVIDRRDKFSPDDPIRIRACRYTHSLSGHTVYVVVEKRTATHWTTLHGFTVRPDEFDAIRAVFNNERS